MTLKLSVLVLVLVRVAGETCLQGLPLHAIEPASSATAACKWECAPGYYHAGTTCRACSSPRIGCPSGWMFQPCTQDADAVCVRCPPLLAGQKYSLLSSSNCNVTECNDGFYYSENSCIVCKEGLFCEQSVTLQCPFNCSTPSPGATNILQCVNADTEVLFTISFIILLSVAIFTQAACPALDVLATYGTFYGCKIAFSTDTLGSLTCQVSAAECVAEQHKAWLAAILLNQTAPTQKLLSECLQSPGLRLGGLKIERTAALSTVSSQKNERLSYPKQPWGIARVEVANALGLFLMVDFVLLLIFIATLAYCCYTRNGSRRLAAAYRKMMLRRR